MTHLTLKVTDSSKMEFLLELLKRMEFVELVSSKQESITSEENFDVEGFVNEIYEERENSKQELGNKLDNLF